MALNIGRKGWIGVGLQSAFEVPAAIADYVPWTTNTLIGIQEQIPVNQAVGHRETIYNTVPGKAYSGGDIEIVLDSKLAGYFLVGALGSVTTQSLGSGVYLHSLVKNDSNVPQFLTVTNYRAVDLENFYDVAINEVQIAVGTDLATLKATCVGNFPQTTTSGTNTTASGNVMSFRNAQFAFGGTVALAQVAPNLKVHDFTLDVKNNVEAVVAHGSGLPRSINGKNLDVTAEFKLYFESVTDKNAYYAQAKQAASLQFTGNAIGGGFYEFLKFNLYQVSMNSFTMETGLDNFFAEDVKLMAEYDPVNQKAIDIQIQNNKALYI